MPGIVVCLSPPWALSCSLLPRIITLVPHIRQALLVLTSVHWQSEEHWDSETWSLFQLRISEILHSTLAERAATVGPLPPPLLAMFPCLPIHPVTVVSCLLALVEGPVLGVHGLLGSEPFKPLYPHDVLGVQLVPNRFPWPLDLAGDNPRPTCATVHAVFLGCWSPAARLSLTHSRKLPSPSDLRPCLLIAPCILPVIHSWKCGRCSFSLFSLLVCFLLPVC